MVKILILVLPIAIYNFNHNRFMSYLIWSEFQFIFSQNQEERFIRTGEERQSIIFVTPKVSHAGKEPLQINISWVSKILYDIVA